ncbi:MAG TPA: hypothetical protein EYQ60_11210 [Myxococcales bacterium]|nr:hypothetical protein [Myxococcales bacterium]
MRTGLRQILVLLGLVTLLGCVAEGYQPAVSAAGDYRECLDRFPKNPENCNHLRTEANRQYDDYEDEAQENWDDAEDDINDINGWF